MRNQTAISNGHNAERRYSSVWPAVHFCASCMAARVAEHGHLCKPCIAKEAERRRYDAWYIERRNKAIVWAAIVLIGAIVLGVNWYVANSGQ